MGAWRHAWRSAAGRPPTQDLVDLERRHGAREAREVRRLVRRGEQAHDVASAQLAVAVAVDALADVEAPEARWRWAAIALMLGLLTTGVLGVALVNGPWGVALVVIAGVGLIGAIRGQGRIAKARAALASNMRLLQREGASIPDSTELAQLPRRWQAAGVVALFVVVVVLYGGLRLARMSDDPDIADAVFSSVIFGVVLVPLTHVLGRRRRERSLRALAA